jgi:hypothetical protein
MKTKLEKLLERSVKQREKLAAIKRRILADYQEAHDAWLQLDRAIIVAQAQLDEAKRKKRGKR